MELAGALGEDEGRGLHRPCSPCGSGSRGSRVETRSSRAPCTGRVRHLRRGVGREVPLLRLVIASPREHRGSVVRPVAAQHRSLMLLRSLGHRLPVVPDLVAVHVSVPSGGDEEVGDGGPRQRGDAVVGRVRHLEIVVGVRNLRRLRGRRGAERPRGRLRGLAESPAPSERAGRAEGHLSSSPSPCSSVRGAPPRGFRLAGRGCAARSGARREGAIAITIPSPSPTQQSSRTRRLF